MLTNYDVDLFVEMTLTVKLKQYLLLGVMAEDSASTVFPLPWSHSQTVPISGVLSCLLYLLVSQDDDFPVICTQKGTVCS